MSAISVCKRPESSHKSQGKCLSIPPDSVATVLTWKRQREGSKLQDFPSSRQDPLRRRTQNCQAPSMCLLIRWEDISVHCQHQKCWSRLATVPSTLHGTSTRRATRSGWNSTRPSPATCSPRTRQDSTNPNSTRLWKILTQKKRAAVCEGWGFLLNMETVERYKNSKWWNFQWRGIFIFSTDFPTENI